MKDSLQLVRTLIEAMPDSLTLAREIIQSMPSSYWATTEPWRIIVMTFTVAVMLTLEPVTFFCLLRYSEFRMWMKQWIEDSDGKPNSVDMLNLFVNWLILICGRTIVIAAVWHMIFHEDQVTLILTLTGATGGLIVRNSLSKTVINEKV